MEGNHEDGQYVNFLFLDGHTEHRRDTKVSGQESDLGYSIFAEKNDQLAHPLTN